MYKCLTCYAEALRGCLNFHAPLEITGEDVTITPLLTPDPESYRPHMLALIKSAQQRLYIQLQYIHPPNEDQDGDFKELLMR